MSDDEAQGVAREDEDSGMEYTALTVEQRIAMLEERILGYEALHYTSQVEHQIATDQGLLDVAVKNSTAMSGFEKAIALCKAEIAKLKGEDVAPETE